MDGLEPGAEDEMIRVEVLEELCKEPATAGLGHFDNVERAISAWVRSQERERVRRSADAPRARRSPEPVSPPGARPPR